MNQIIKADIFDYEKCKEYVSKLCREYDFLSAKVIGRTALGRAIFSFSVGNRKNSVLYAAGFHGSEWLTSLVLLNFIEKLCHCLKTGSSICSINISKAFSDLGAVFVPCVNPDGVEIAVHGPESTRSLRRFVEKIECDDYSKWNANALGVDINHNFNAGKDILRQMEEESGINGPSPRQYGGKSAESECETKAITNLCRREKFRQAIALHSQGEELFWQYGENTPSKSLIMAKILADSCDYKLVQNSALASHGGFKDWFIEEFHKPAFTIEVGKGENPLPVCDLFPICNKVEEALTIFALM